MDLFDSDIIESFNMYILIATLAESSKYSENNIAASILKNPSEN